MNTHLPPFLPFLLTFGERCHILPRLYVTNNDVIETRKRYIVYLRPVKWMPKLLIQFTFTKKPPFCTIRNIENCPLFRVKQKLFRKKTVVSLVVKSRNYYREGIRCVVKAYYKAYPNIFENSVPIDQKW